MPSYFDFVDFIGTLAAYRGHDYYSENKININIMHTLIPSKCVK